MMLKTISVCLFFICLSLSVSGQHFLHLRKTGTAKSNSIKIGDLVMVKANGEKYRGRLSQIQPDAIMVDYEIVELKDIISIRVTNRFVKGLGRSLQYGGVFFTGIFVANSLFTGLSPILTTGNYIFLGSLIGVGILLELISHKHYKMKKGWVIGPIIFDES